ncbi:MAG: hypothetical protein JO199_06220, partial [Candidatus Eremiobacteraeota bacterium]|nr:hypothetical protein [Candidatus Eremiobacteraeota bacterium]
TKSVELTVAPAGKCGGCTKAFTTYASLLPTSKSCTFDPAGITCTIPIAIASGTYTGKLSTYDGPPKCSSCSELSANQSFKIVASTTVKIPTIVLAGVVHGLNYTILDSGLMTQRNGNVGIVGASSKARMLLYAYDADGNVIFGPGSPKFAVSSASTVWKASVSGDVLEVQAPASIGPGQNQLKISAVAPGCNPATCESSVYVQFDPLVAAALPSTNNVVIYPSHFYDGPVFANVTKGVSSPAGIAFDKTGNLFVANAGNGSVTEYAQPYTGAPIATFAGVTGNPAILAASSNGYFAVGDVVNKQVHVFKPPSTTAVATISLVAAPGAIVFDGANDLWVGSQNLVARYASPYTGAPNKQLTAGNGIGTPVGLGFDMYSELYVADAGSNQILSFPTPYTGTPAQTIADSGIDWLSASGYVIAACSKTALDFVDPGGQTVGATQPIGDNTPQICALDRNDDLYDTDTAFSQIGEFDYPAYKYFGRVAALAAKPAALAAYP